MSTVFEFTPTEIKKPSPPITSILDFINGDGSEGIAPQKETTRDGDHFHSLLPIEPPPMETTYTIPVEAAKEVIDAIRFSTENELIAYWLQTNGYDSPDKPNTEQAFAEAMLWAKQFLADTAEQATKSTSVEQFSKLLDPEKQPGEVTSFEFCMSESLDTTEAPDPIALPADYAKLYQEAIEKWKEDCFRAESDFKVRLEKLKKDQTDAAIAIEKAGEVVKQTKKVHKAIMLRLMNALDSGATFPDRPSMPTVIEASESTHVTPDGKTVTKIVTGNQDTSWRNISTSEVLGESMEGLGPKKRELLIEHFATLGDLEDARGKASIDYKNFSEFLPEGIGKELASRIEDAMMDAIGKFSPDLAAI